MDKRTVSVKDNYTLSGHPDTGDEVVIVGELTGVATMQLPSMADTPPGKQITFKSRDTTISEFPVRLNAAVGDLIMGAAYVDMNVAHGVLTISHDGHQWNADGGFKAMVAAVNEGGTGATNSEAAVANLSLVTRTPCRVATTVNIASLNGGAPDTVDGVALQLNDRVLVVNQANTPENGPYTVKVLGTGSNGTFTRADDLDEDSDIVSGMEYTILEGDTYHDQKFILASEGPYTLGTDPLVFTQTTGAAAIALTEGSVLIGNNADAAQERVITGEVSLSSTGETQVQAVEESRAYKSITNKTGNTLAKGTLVRLKINAADGSYGVDVASATGGIPATHVVGADIANDANGTIYSRQTIQTLDTSGAAAVGSPVYLGLVNGDLAFDTPPTAANEIAQVVGHVVVKDATTGQVSFSINGGLQVIGTNNLQYGSVTSDKIASVDPAVLKTFVYNKTGNNLPSGTMVALIPNSDGAPGVVRADSDLNIVATHVVAGLDIANDGSGYVVEKITFGSQDTSTAAGVGSKLYLTTAGGYVFDTPPAGADKTVQLVGYVAVKDNVSGVVMLMPSTVESRGTSSLQDASVTAAKLSITASVSPASETLTSPSARIYTGSVTGAPVVGATLLQDNTAATGIVTAVNGNGSFDVDTVTGTFSTTDLVTGTNPDTTTFTFTPPEELLDVWGLADSAIALSSITANDGTCLVLGHKSFLLSPGKVRYQPTLADSLETLASDGWTTLYVDYALGSVTIS